MYEGPSGRVAVVASRLLHEGIAVDLVPPTPYLAGPLGVATLRVPARHLRHALAIIGAAERTNLAPLDWHYAWWRRMVAAAILTWRVVIG